MEGFVFLIVAGTAIWFLSLIVSAFSRARRYDHLKPRLDNLEQAEKVFLKKIDEFKESRNIEIKNWETKVQNDKNAIEVLYKQKSMGFPWLANAYAEYFALGDKRVEDYLTFKKRPAFKAAEAVKEAATRRRNAEKMYRVTKYKLEYYENLFPWLCDLLSEDEDDELPINVASYENDGRDPAQIWLTPEEYSKLPSYRKYQLALERYLKKRKSKWEIGRDYERYIGYIWEDRGYRVTYKGIIDGFEDMGRDLIALKGDEIDVIQCKCWSSKKTIHEKHIFQLFGTTMELWLKNNNHMSNSKTLFEFANLLREERVRPVFVTSTVLSDVAKQMADTLNVVVYEKYLLHDYPRIKCNISSKDGEKIYHLPFDQQYDKVVIEPEKGEFYASTVKEAEEAGFRRAYRWQGSK